MCAVPSVQDSKLVLGGLDKYGLIDLFYIKFVRCCLISLWNCLNTGEIFIGK